MNTKQPPTSSGGRQLPRTPRTGRTGRGMVYADGRASAFLASASAFLEASRASSSALRLACWLPRRPRPPSWRSPPPRLALLVHSSWILRSSCSAAAAPRHGLPAARRPPAEAAAIVSSFAVRSISTISGPLVGWLLPSGAFASSWSWPWFPLLFRVSPWFPQSSFKDLGDDGWTHKHK